MEFLSLILLIALGLHALNTQDQRHRMAVLSGFLRPYEIEKLMAQLTDGYLRALGEDDPGRQAQVWQVFQGAESRLSQQVSGLAQDLARLAPAEARVSTLALGLPRARQWFARASFDLREALRIHADGIVRTVQNLDGQTPKARAHRLTAELLLLQHTCHWYCKSRAVASARLLARHQTTHAQVLTAVAPATRDAYARLLAH